MSGKKKTCEKCRALERRDGTFITNYICTLGYNLHNHLAHPLEPCPKPLTYKKYLQECRGK